MEVDIDHQASHVDPNPHNNLATVEVTIDESIIETVTLTPATAASDAPIGTFVGKLDGATTAPNTTLRFELVSGGQHNDHFRIMGSRLLTAKTIDVDTDQLSLRIRARASNGDTLEQDFTVEVTRAAESKACNWPNDSARGLLCPSGQNRPFLVNGTTRKNPARICTHGPDGPRLADGCHHLWYNQGDVELVPVPWQQIEFPAFLARLQAQADKGEKANYCLAEAEVPNIVFGPQVPQNEPGKPSWTQTRTCVGDAKACGAWEDAECVLGEPLPPLEGPIPPPPETELRWMVVWSHTSWGGLSRPSRTLGLPLDTDANWSGGSCLVRGDRRALRRDVSVYLEATPDLVCSNEGAAPGHGSYSACVGWPGGNVRLGYEWAVQECQEVQL